MITREPFSTIWSPGSRSLRVGHREAALYGMVTGERLSTVWQQGSHCLQHDLRIKKTSENEGSVEQTATYEQKTYSECVRSRKTRGKQPIVGENGSDR